jgi:phosphoglycolate phosphatase-like HAD superfamily hydrolase/ADP-ribose pyrophosphatase YjhB (NUDIX family)
VIRNIIFDWSGTLVDDLPAVWEATNYVLKNAGLPAMTLEEFRSEFSLPFINFYRRFTPHIPMDKLEEWFHARFFEVQDKVVEIKYAREFLEFCEENKMRKIVLSSVRPDHFERQAKKVGFDKFINSAYLGVYDKRHTIRDLLQKEKIDPLQTLYIGDMEHDIETARFGGVYSCAVLTGYNHSHKLREAEPDLIVENLNELKNILQKNEFKIGKEILKKTTANSKPVVTVGALIFNEENKVLLVQTHKWSNLWGIPGGKIKYGEPSEEALKREIKEETGLDIHSIQFVMVQDCIHSDEFYRDEHFILLNYVCKFSSSENVRLNEEAHNYVWVDLKEALKMPLNLPTKRLVEEVLNKGITKIE